MDFREIHITQPSQLKYRNKCVSIRTNDQLIDLIPLSEINTIVVDSAQVIFSEPFLLGIGVSLIHDVDMSLSYNRDQISMMKRAMDNDDRDSDK